VSVPVSVGLLVVAFQTPMYFKSVDGRFASGTFPPLSKEQYPLLAFLLAKFSGVNPRASCFQDQTPFSVSVTNLCVVSSESSDNAVGIEVASAYPACE